MLWANVMCKSLTISFFFKKKKRNGPRIGGLFTLKRMSHLSLPSSSDNNNRGVPRLCRDPNRSRESGCYLCLGPPAVIAAPAGSCCPCSCSFKTNPDQNGSAGGCRSPSWAIMSRSRSIRRGLNQTLSRSFRGAKTCDLRTCEKERIPSVRILFLKVGYLRKIHAGGLPAFTYR